MHSFHAWELIAGKTYASLHLTVTDGSHFVTVQGIILSCCILLLTCVIIPFYYHSMLIDRIKRILHKNGIHFSTIQPEFEEEDVCSLLTFPSIFYFFFISLFSLFSFSSISCICAVSLCNRLFCFSLCSAEAFAEARLEECAAPLALS